MSLERVQAYQEEQESLLNALAERLRPEQVIIAHGSVVRVLGPYNDVDVVSVRTSNGPPFSDQSVGGVRVQTEVMCPEELYRHMFSTSRGSMLALDNRILGVQNETVSDMVDARAQTAKGEGRAQLVAALITEQSISTQRPDIFAGKSRFALKRSLGGKRSVAHSLVIAGLVSAPDTLGAAPVKRFSTLLDLGLIDEKTIDAIYDVNQLLVSVTDTPDFRQAWKAASAVTEDWVRRVQVLASDFMRSQPGGDFQNALEQSLSDDPEDQQAAFAYLSQNGTGALAAETIMWRLLSNPSLTRDHLEQLWGMIEKLPGAQLSLGSVAVQHVQFPNISVSEDSPVLLHPDIQFALRYRGQGVK